MKKITLFFAWVCIALSCSETSFAQADFSTATPERIAKLEQQIDIGLQKSKKQKRLAWILLGGGAATTIIGNAVLTNNDNPSSDRGTGAAVVFTGLGSAAWVASVPVFFSSSKNGMKARLAEFEKNIETAATQSDRQRKIDNAVIYLKGKSKPNNIAGIALLAVGGISVVSGIGVASKHSGSSVGDFLERGWGTALIISGVSFGALSIPFFVRGSQYKHAAQHLEQSGNIPDALFTVSPAIFGRPGYTGVGLSFALAR
ncbi:MAG: hypothetical protein J5I50_13330 [Chitinophagaceae bacterium]|nr:hypothetical protein [Chitinophagaceae bacterium]